MATITHTIALRADSKKAIDTIKEYGDTVVAVTSKVVGMEASLGGDKVLLSANNYTAAIARLGGATGNLATQEQILAGASRLTESEKARLNSTITEAIAKYEALGHQAPTAMRQLAEATTTSVTRSSSALSGLASQLSYMFSIGAVIAFGRSILQAGDQITKMADQTGMSAEQVQRLGYVAGQSGLQVESLVGATQNLQQRLGDDTTGAAGAMRKLNINVDEFNKLGTYDQMMLLGQSVGSIKDPTDRASVAAALFGKTWKEIMPALIADMERLAAQAPLMSNATVASLDRIGDALRRSEDQAKAWGGSLVLSIEGIGFRFGDFLSKFSPSHFGMANSMLLAMQTQAAQLEGAIQTLPPPMMKTSAAATMMGVSMAEADRISKELTASAAKSIAEHEKQEREFEAVTAKIRQLEFGYIGLSNSIRDVGFVYEPVSAAAWKWGEEISAAARKAAAALLVVDTAVLSIGESLHVIATEAKGTGVLIPGLFPTLESLEAQARLPGSMLGGMTRPMFQGLSQFAVAPMTVQRYASGGPITQDGPIITHAGEFVVPKSGTLVSGGGGSVAPINIYITQPLGTPDAIARVVGAALTDRSRNLGLRAPTGA